MSSSYRLLTEAEVAQKLECSVAKIRKLRAAGRLAFLPGRPVLILPRDLEEFQRKEAEAAYARWEKRPKGKRGKRPPKPPEHPDASIHRRAAMLMFKLRWAAELKQRTKS